MRNGWLNLFLIHHDAGYSLAALGVIGLLGDKRPMRANYDPLGMIFVVMLIRFQHAGSRD